MSSTLFCTYCSARKRRGRAKLPAVRRYLSPRIRRIYRMSREAGASFAILSGRFGFLDPYQEIPCYDHLLQPDEVDSILPQMAGYLKKKGIRRVHFFHDPLEDNPELTPYREAVRKACRRARIPLTMVELKPKK